MKTIKVAAPAKINLTLEVLGKRDDGFHDIKSVMQAISLYDYLSFSVEDCEETRIILSGNSSAIPYDERNLVYKAIDKFLTSTKIQNKAISVYIEKNIPVEAGLAGGSTDAAATFVALNNLFSYPLSSEKLNEFCSSLGSDLNFCLNGGTALCTGRGENIIPIETPVLDISLIKPLGFGISAKEAYTKFSQMSPDMKLVPNNTEKMCKKFSSEFLYNSLEFAVINHYDELLEIKTKLPNSMMSGSGPTFFVLDKGVSCDFDTKRFFIIDGLKSISDGVRIVC